MAIRAKGYINFKMKIIDNSKIFLKEVRLEMKKVNWLSRREMTNYTLLVIGVVLFMAFYFGLLDYIFSSLLNRFILNK